MAGLQEGLLEGNPSIPPAILPSANPAIPLFVLVVFVRAAGRDVVDVGQCLVHVVHVVQREGAAGRLHRDGAARSLFALLLALLTAARRLGVGTEVAAARRRRRRRIEWTGSAKAAAAGAWSTEAAAATRPRAAEAAGPRRPRRAAGTRTTRAPILARARFADGQRAPVEDLPVELLNRLLRMRAILKFDEGESSRASRFAVDGHDHLRRWSNRAEVVAEIRFSGRVRQIADEQTDGQSTLS